MAESNGSEDKVAAKVQVDSLSRWLTLLANIAVFASIMFLAIEIRQNQTAIEESNRLSVLEARALEVEQFNEFRSQIVESPELWRIWVDGFDDKPLDAQDERKYMTLCNNFVWISASSYERSMALGRTEAAEATTSIRATMIDDSERFKSCWLFLRDMFVSYGVGNYVDAVEAMVTTELPARE